MPWPLRQHQVIPYTKEQGQGYNNIQVDISGKYSCIACIICHRDYYIQGKTRISRVGQTELN